MAVDEGGKNFESDVSELSRLRSTYLKNPMIGYLNIYIGYLIYLITKL